MKYYIIAGEASGDLHGSNLVRELRRQDPQAEIRCWGGDKMAEAGGVLVKHYRDLAFMGFAEVLLNLRTIFRNLAFCKKDILAFQPDVLILVDYPGFNLRIAKWARRQSLFGNRASRIVYYISPQVWAWKEGRVKMMKACIDRMLVILPFEKGYYHDKWNWEVEYVGHPLLEEIEKRTAEPLAARLSDLPVIALLPGSRKQEIRKKLPVMLEVSRSFPGYRFIVARAPGVDHSFYDSMLRPYPNVSAVTGRTYDLLQQSVAALVTSGTATLETALFGVPEVVCYKGSWLSYQIGKRLVKVKYISLVNLIMDKPVVKELIQHEMNVPNLCRELELLLHNPEKQEQLRADYATLQKMLVQEGHASARAAASILAISGQQFDGQDQQA